MSHHASDFSDEMKLSSEFGDFALGATGNFPRGKIDRLDEGEICFAIAADHKTDTVLINFGKQVVWLGMTADEAIEIANSLRDKAIEIKTKSTH
jgi:hypothetical protein